MTQDTQDTQAPKEEPRKLNLYKHTLSSAQYVFGSDPIKGRVAAFVKHLYATDDPHEIKELEELVNTASRGVTKYIYVDKDQQFVGEDYLNPNGALKVQLREELLQELKSQGRLRDFGETEDRPSLKGIAGTTRLTPSAVSNSGVQPTVSRPTIIPGAV